MTMYQDWMQWARLAYACLMLFIVWTLTQPWAIESYQELIFPGWIQVSLFTIASGLMFPKSRRFDLEEGSDGVQFTAGMFISWLAWAASFLP
jgi:hypothetical protein